MRLVPRKLEKLEGGVIKFVCHIIRFESVTLLKKIKKNRCLQVVVVKVLFLSIEKGTRGAIRTGALNMTNTIII